MKKMVALLLAFGLLVSIACGLTTTVTHATEKRETIAGKTYDLGEDDEYELSKAQEVSDVANRFYLSGDIESVGTQDGFVSYAASAGNLKLMVDNKFAENLFKPNASTDWHIVSDGDDTVDGTELADDIESGAILIQTSKNGKAWITVDEETDIYNKMDGINNRTINGEETNAFYELTNLQVVNGCYYRIVVAYKLERETGSSQFLFWDNKDYDKKERVEIYQFYAFDPSVSKTETIGPNNTYEFSEVKRVDSQDGFTDPVALEADDPHIDWTVGKFYVSGFTSKKLEDGIPVFLKVPEDRVALWFDLEQELDKCHGDTGIKVNYIDSGSDKYFETPTIANFGRGALIIRKTDHQNKKERQIYTNYLEASAVVGANTRVDLFEEGDYEVALDYQLHYDKPIAFGITTTKTLTYQVFFKFKVRNGDISAFLRDVDTGQFITNSNVAEHGFYIDVAQSHNLEMSITRDVLTDSLDGLVRDTKFSGVATEGRNYTDEGIYTVTVKNPATGDSIEKTVYVGNRDIMLAHVKTGKPLSEINERLSLGAYIDEDGNIIDPEAEVAEKTEQIAENGTEEPVEKPEKESEFKILGINIYVIIAIGVVLCLTLVLLCKKRIKKRKSKMKSMDTIEDNFINNDHD